MTINKYAIVHNILTSRKKIIEIIVVTVLLALGISLIGGQIITLRIFSPAMIISVGTVLCVISVLYILANLFVRHVENNTYEAFFIYSKKKNEIIPVPRYKFSEMIYEYLRGAFEENPALKTLWEKDSFNGLLDIIMDRRKSLKSVQLLSEAVEYLVLDMLSTHLADYFNTERFKKKNLKEYERNDIPEVLLRNRFLELFSRPMEDRPAFVNEALRKKEDGEVVRVRMPGAIYSKFDLVLPKDSYIRKPGDNKIEIETKKLKMVITVQFLGFNTVLPEGFEEYYMGIKEEEDINIYKVDINIKVLKKLSALFSKAGWEYYYWVDSFLDEIEDSVSQDAFFDQIGWETVFTVLQCFNHGQSKSESVPK